MQNIAFCSMIIAYIMLIHMQLVNFEEFLQGTALFKIANTIKVTIR